MGAPFFFGAMKTKPAWWFKVAFLMVKWPFLGLSDLQLGDDKDTLNHLVVGCFFFLYTLRILDPLMEGWKNLYDAGVGSRSSK